jgi:predicted DNA binding protein
LFSRYGIETMSVVGGFAVATEGFALGRALAVEDVRVELAAVVPTGGHATDLRVWTDDPDAFVDRIRERPPIVDASLRDRVEGGALLHATWTSDEPDAYRGVAEAGLALLAASGDERAWSFRVRAPDWSAVTAFRSFCERHAVDVRLRHVSEGAGGPATDDALTALQRETLTVAFRRGYFDSPRGVTLEELAVEFDVSPRAVSQRLRRGLSALVERGLPVDDT